MATASVASSEQKQKYLATALTQIERSYGKGAIMRWGVDGARVHIEAIPTGAMNLDVAIGIGGIPRGRISEIYGPESSGKTTLCLHVIANAMAIWTNRFCNEKTPGLVFAMERFRDGFASGFPPDRNFSGFF